MKRVAIVLSILGVLAPSLVTAEVLIDAASGKSTGIRVVSDLILNKEAPSLVLDFHVEALTASEVATPKGPFTLLAIPGYQHSGAIGAPSLPVMNRIVEVPFGATLKVKVLGSEKKEYDLKDLGVSAPLFPRQPSHPKDGTEVPFAHQPSTYVTKGWLQDDLAAVDEIGVMRHVRLALVRVAPVAYNPTENKLEVYHDVRVELSLRGANLDETARIKAIYGTPAFDWVYSQVLSPESLRQMNDRGKARPVTYAIVADRMFEQPLQPFIQWKTKKGYRVLTSYTDTIGTTLGDIKGYLHGLYNGATEEKPAPAFVLFAGDKEQIPAFRGASSYHITDLPYIAVTQGDNIPDMLSGRFSAQTTATFVPQVAKTVEYEKFAFPDPSFLTHVVMIAGWDYSHAVEWGWPQINYGTKYYFNAAHGITNPHVYLSSGSSQNEDQIVADVSAGCSYLNYTAHGSNTSWADPGFSISDINGLNNQGKYPLVVGNCCLTNSFQVSTCFGEAWLRADGKGAIGYIGGSNSTYWDEDLWWGNGFYPIAHPNPEGLSPNKEDTTPGAYDGVFEGNYATNAGMMVAGNLAVEASNSSRKLYYWEVYHLMGDPAVMVYWGIPQDTAVEHPAEVAPGSGEIEIKAPAGAYVGITVGSKLVGGGFVPQDGKGLIGIDEIPESGTGSIVVTGKNLKPYFGTFEIKAPEQPEE